MGLLGLGRLLIATTAATTAATIATIAAALLVAALLVAALLVAALLVAALLPTLLVALLRLLLRILGIHFALRLSQHPQIMLCVLLKALSRHAVMAQLRVTGQLVVFIDDLLGRTANLALRT